MGILSLLKISLFFARVGSLIFISTFYDPLYVIFDVLSYPLHLTFYHILSNWRMVYPDHLFTFQIHITSVSLVHPIVWLFIMLSFSFVPNFFPFIALWTLLSFSMMPLCSLHVRVAYVSTGRIN